MVESIWSLNLRKKEGRKRKKVEGKCWQIICFTHRNINIFYGYTLLNSTFSYRLIKIDQHCQRSVLLAPEFYLSSVGSRNPIIFISWLFSKNYLRMTQHSLRCKLLNRCATKTIKHTEAAIESDDTTMGLEWVAEWLISSLLPDITISYSRWNGHNAIFCRKLHRHPDLLCISITRSL